MNEQARPENESMNEDSRVRAYWYGFLSTLFAAALDEDQLMAIRNLEGNVESDSPLNKELNALINNAKSKDLAQLKREFSNVYIGLGRGEVIPYASWHITGFLMEKPLADIRADMRRLGLSRNEEVKEPEDGIAFLLSSMALLSDRAIGDQQHFFETHISNWVDSLFEATEKAESADFYKDATRLLKEWISIERQYFGQELTPS